MSKLDSDGRENSQSSDEESEKEVSVVEPEFDMNNVCILTILRCNPFLASRG